MTTAKEFVLTIYPRAAQLGFHWSEEYHFSICDVLDKITRPELLGIGKTPEEAWANAYKNINQIMMEKLEQ